MLPSYFITGPGPGIEGFNQLIFRYQLTITAGMAKISKRNVDFTSPGMEISS